MDSSRQPTSTRSEERTVLFVDLCDSTRIYERYGDEGGRRLVLQCMTLLSSPVAGHQGRVIDQIGDELMCVFPGAGQAIEAARAMQSAMLTASESERFPETLHVRIGLAHGMLVLDDKRVYGETVHVARRIGSAAKAQQILTTAETVRLLPIQLQPVIRFVDRTHVKGKSHPIEIVEIVWDEIAATEVAGHSAIGGVAATPGAMRELLVRHAGASHVVSENRPILRIGRQSPCEVVIEHKVVSRLHARIEYRKGAFAFVDHSTNGSSVEDEHGELRFVRRDAAPLPSRGRIVLGYKAPTGAPVLEFEVQEA